MYSELSMRKFLDEESSKSEYCYKVIPLEIASDARQMTLNGFERVYKILGELGYRFRDAGHNAEYVIISLNKPISQKHLKKLEATLSISEDTGIELSVI